MVSNDEISQRLRNKREGKPLNYLVCNKCGGYYELQPGESSESFDLECECGGWLIPSTSDSLFSSEEKDYGSEIFLCYALFIFGGFPSFVGGLYLFTRPNERAKFHGKIILGICIAFLIVVFFIWTLLIYRAYFSQPVVDPATDLSSVRSMRLFAACFLI